MQNLKNKYGNTALITGGSSGIGKAFAFEFARLGIEPILIARNKENLETVAHEISTTYNLNVLTYSVDLSNENAIQDFLKEITSLNIGMFIHCAGMENNGGFTKLSTEKELQLIKLNVTSTYILTKHFAKKMTEVSKGVILLVSSMVGLMPTPYFTNYAASKSYVHNLGISLHAELKSKGVDVSVLAPGLTETNMIQDNGVDWSKLPFSSQKPEEVVQITLRNLGRKATIIPGFMNKMMVAIGKRFFSLKSFSYINRYMIEKAISKEKI